MVNEGGSLSGNASSMFSLSFHGTRTTCEAPIHDSLGSVAWGWRLISVEGRMCLSNASRTIALSFGTASNALTSTASSLPSKSQQGPPLCCQRTATTPGPCGSGRSVHPHGRSSSRGVRQRPPSRRRRTCIASLQGGAPTSIRQPHISGAAAGHGTRAQRVGCSAPASRAFLGSGSGAPSCIWTPASQELGDVRDDGTPAIRAIRNHSRQSCWGQSGRRRRLDLVGVVRLGAVSSASASSSACASAISGISGVGEKPSSAGASTSCASTGRPVDW